MSSQPASRRVIPSTTEEVSTSVGAELRRLRKTAAWSLQQTCDGSGRVVDISRLSRAERDDATLRPEVVARIERALRAEIRLRMTRMAATLKRDGREKDRSAVA
jgi:transcriptional regulator with XRE-family HTH domain